MANDFNQKGFIRFLPKNMKAYYLLARFDRPVGWGLLFLPCSFGLVLGAHELQHAGLSCSFGFLLFWLLLLAFGAMMMRGAGCVWNDILDRKIDAGVERTKDRPLAAKIITVPQALFFATLLLLPSLSVFLLLPLKAKITVCAILPLVLLYPLMKRVMMMPQLILGLVFNWGIFVGYSIVTHEYPLTMSVVFLWVAGIFWTLGYDTIYACQDRKYDIALGVKSLAVLLGDRVKILVSSFYLFLTLFYGLAFASWAIFIAIAVLNLSVLRAIYRIDLDVPAECLRFFKNNVRLGSGYFLISYMVVIFYP